ncbi:unnamed protein product [Ascophyllum nodosum]
MENPKVLAGFDNWDDIPPDIARFIAKSGAAMEDELNRSDASQAFIGYTPLEEGDDNEITLHYALSCDLSKLLDTRRPDSTKLVGERKTLQATGVHWSPTGSIVAASFGRNDIVGWCDLPGALVLWNIFRRGFADEEEHAPDVVLDHNSCLMCVSCHPKIPAVVAAGSFNGEVVVWDTSRDEPLVATTKIDDVFHREPVTSLSWMYSAKVDDYRIAAVSGDGKLLFWSLKNNLQCPVEGYIIPAEKWQDERDGSLTVRGVPRLARPAGCAALSFLSEGRHVTSAVIGTEGGAPLKCSLASSSKVVAQGCKSLRWSPDADEMLCRIPEKQRRQVAREVETAVKTNRGTEVDLPSIFRSRLEPALLYPLPSVFRMEKHFGPVHSIDCSPFHRALFLSSGADGSARLYNTLQSRAVLTFEPSNSNLMDVRWSKARPLVFAAGAEDGGIFIYDLLQSSVIPVASAYLPSGSADLPSSRASGFGEKAVCGAAYSVAFNPKQRDLLATGDSKGRVIIWRVSWRLANKRPGEDDGLEQLFKGSASDHGTRDDGD